MRSIAHHIPRKVNVETKQLIPLKIFQTWKSKELPEKMYEVVNKIVELNPEYDYYFFDDDDCRKYLQDNYSSEYLDAFDDLIPGAFKADFWRYAVIAKEGGVYIDVDFDCVKPLREILDSDDSLVLVKDRGIGCCTAIFQAFFAATPNHNAIKETLQLCLDNIKNKRMGKTCLDLTGPGMMGKAFNKYTYGKICDVELNTGTFVFNGEKYRILIHSFDECTVVDKNNIILFKTKFAEYDQLRTDNYGILHQQGRIFNSGTPSTSNSKFGISALIIFIVLLILLLIILSRKR